MTDEDDNDDQSEVTVAPVSDSNWMRSSDAQVAARANPGGDADGTDWATGDAADASQAQESAYPWSAWSASAPFAPGTDPAPPARPGVRPIGQIQARGQDRQDGMDGQGAQIARINESDPYISATDGRWKKQSVNPATGEINETDILDSGAGKIDRGTGHIYVQTSRGPQVISVDPQQQRLAQIVDQKNQSLAQGSPMDADIAAARSLAARYSAPVTGIPGDPGADERADREVCRPGD